MELKLLIDSVIQVIKDALVNTNWLFTPIEIGDLSISPILILSFPFLIALLGVAIVKWIAS